MATQLKRVTEDEPHFQQKAPPFYVDVSIIRANSAPAHLKREEENTAAKK